MLARQKQFFGTFLLFVMTNPVKNGNVANFRKAQSKLQVPKEFYLRTDTSGKVYNAFTGNLF